MNPGRRLLRLSLVGLGLILVAGLGAWFVGHLEQRTLTLPAPASAAARRNPFLAAERFLTRLSVPVESRSGRELLRAPPPVTDTLVVRGLGRLDVRHRTRLRDWLAQGGRLVAAPEGPPGAGSADDLPADFGIGLVEDEDEDEDEDGEGNEDAPGPDQALGTLRPADGGPELRIAFLPGLALEAQTETETDACETVHQVPAEGRRHLIEIPVGAGRLTVVSDLEFLTNERIGEQDHALALAHLAAPRAGGKVWLLYAPRVPWLVVLLWQAAPGALAAAGLTLLVWAWSLGARLGPRVPPPGRARRDLLEHLDAAAAFLWRHDRAAALAAGVRQAVLERWQRRRPDLRHRPSAEQAAVLAAATGLTPESVTAALATAAHDPQGFVRHTRTLKTLAERGTRPRRGAAPADTRRAPGRPPSETT